MTDFFLKIDGIPGESMDDKHRDEIDIASFQWGASNASDRSMGGGAAAGKASLQDFTFMMQISKASPALFLSCATGKHIKEAILTGRRAGKEQQEYLKVKMTDLLITSYMTSGSEGGDGPMDAVSFNFGRLDLEYFVAKPDGSLGAPVTASYDLSKVRKV